MGSLSHAYYQHGRVVNWTCGDSLYGEVTAERNPKAVCQVNIQGYRFKGDLISIEVFDRLGDTTAVYEIVELKYFAPSEDVRVDGSHIRVGMTLAKEGEVDKQNIFQPSSENSNPSLIYVSAFMNVYTKQIISLWGCIGSKNENPIFIEIPTFRVIYNPMSPT